MATTLALQYDVDDGLEDNIRKGIYTFSLVAIESEVKVPTMFINFLDEGGFLPVRLGAKSVSRISLIQYNTKWKIKPVGALTEELYMTTLSTPYSVVNSSEYASQCKKLAEQLMVHGHGVERLLNMFHEKLVDIPYSPSQETIDNVFTELQKIGNCLNLSIIR